MNEGEPVKPEMGYPGVGFCCCGAIILYFFGHYWLANPDIDYLTNGTSTVCAANGTSGEVIILNSADTIPKGLTNVTQGFVSWF